jgi:hypothetical protein
MRFEDRLRPHFKIDPATIGARLPSLLLQPLIEKCDQICGHSGRTWRRHLDYRQREGAACGSRSPTAAGARGRRRCPVDRVGWRTSGPSGAGLWPAQAFHANERTWGFSVIIEIPLETDQKDFHDHSHHPR